ncbi:MAG: phosphoribosylaminoimidazolesuccinocarboxamide synthase [Deinococcales bacterium]
MLEPSLIQTVLPHTLTDTQLPELGPKSQGKVRDIYHHNHELILITTDRLSAFDRVLGAVPYKGQVLNQLSLFWFDEVKDIIGNYVRHSPHPSVIIGEACQTLPVEVIVRGYISGVTKTALWYRYSLGEREIYGHHFPEGLQKNSQLPEPIITPTTKGGVTGHDERLTCEEVVSQGYVEAKLWDRVQTAALEVFKRGAARAKAAGLILVDTKYEFGLNRQGDLVLIDEVHTPDSSRFWRLDSYQSRFEMGQEPENFDKEFIRLAYAEKGYRGDGDPPAWDENLAIFASQRYQQVYEMLSGKTFGPMSYPAQEDIRKALL